MVKRLLRVLFVGVLMAVPVPFVASPASAGDNGGCGSSYTKDTVTNLAAFAASLYPEPVDWAAFLSSIDKNTDTFVCWHWIGKVCSCGNHAFNVVDNNAKANDPA